MEENVALDSSKQKQFVKSIKGIKKLIKKNDTEGATEKILKSKEKDGTVTKRKRKPRGLVYLGHIPHGFYEHEMTQYFKQFGMVTNVRVIRSKKSGASKGYAFVEFKEPAVAEIVAETMNNYLMGKRLIKAAIIPPEKQKLFARRKHWNAEHNPANEKRLKMKSEYNQKIDEDGEIKKARALLKTLNKNRKKFSALGINYDFFTPVDVPEALKEILNKPEVKNMKSENVVDKKSKSKLKQEKAKLPETKEKLKVEKTGKKTDLEKTEVKDQKKKDIKKEKKTQALKEQPHKEKKLKERGVKPVENFITIKQASDNESNSDYDFDSDEFDKMMANGDSNDSASGSDQDAETDQDDESLNNDSESEEEVTPPKKNKKQQKPLQNKKQEAQLPSPVLQKRKAAPKPPVSSKKSKFENRNTQKLTNKQFKKRK